MRYLYSLRLQILANPHRYTEPPYSLFCSPLSINDIHTVDSSKLFYKSHSLIFHLLMAYLTELSTELLLLVCSYLCPMDKVNVLRVCKLLQQIAEPSLYADIHLRRCRFPISNHSLHRLLASAVTVPAIASHVKRFHTVGPRNINVWYGSRQTWLSDQDFGIISSLARSAATAGEEEQWAEDAEHDNSDLFQALLISQFPTSRS